MKCVSLFSGAGGLDQGLEAAGFEVVASVEQDVDCCRTLELNGRKNVINSDVSSVSFTDLGLAGEVDLLAGGPPCQPFSKSAQWTKAGALGLKDPRARTIHEFVRGVKELRPRAFLLENVEGFGRLGGLDALNVALAHLHSRGLRYSLNYAILNAAEFGVPQKRRRFFAIGLLAGSPFIFPRPTHGIDGSPYMTAWDACASVAAREWAEPLATKGRWADLLPTIPPGQNYLFHTSRGEGEPLFGWRTRFWSFLYKLDPAKPSPTIVAHPSQNSGPFHWENRLLATDELAALQTFPASYDFHGNRASRQRQIGNAVPPLLGETVGRSLIVQLGGDVRDELRFALGRATSDPLTSPTAALPAKYRHQIGKHADHPGTGRGPKPRPTWSDPITQQEGELV
jgi:DNA (cytosine-5)-methyltransferase 1